MIKILAIDDQKDNLTSIKAVIKSNIPHCQILTALSGKEGIKIAKKEQPDTILLDIIMPEMDGYEVCKKLKADELTKRIPVIMITAIKTDSESRVKSLNCGADAFLSKPIDSIELSAQVNVMLRIKEAEDKLREEKELLDKRVEERTKELKKSEEKYRLMTTNTLDTIWTTDIEFNLTFINNAVSDFLGYTPEEFIGLNSAVFTTPDGMKAIQNAAGQLISKYKKGEISQAKFELQQIRKDGEIIDVEIRADLLMDSDGQLIGFQGRSVDITERKQAEKALKESEKKYKSVIDNITDGYYRSDKSGDVILISPSVEKILGFSKNEIIGKKISSFYANPKDREAFLDEIKKSGSVENYHAEFRRKKQDNIFIETNSKIYCDESGEYAGVEGTFRDITDRYQAEHETKMILNTATGAMRLIDEDFNIVKVNDNFIEMLKLPEDEVIGKKCYDVFSGKLCHTKDCPLIKLKNTDENKLELEVYKKLPDGKEIPTMLTSTSYRDVKGNFIGVVEDFKDITNRKQAEHDLKESEEQFRFLSSVTFEGIVLHKNGVIKDVNESFLKITGYTREEAIGNNMLDYIPNIKDRAKIMLNIVKKHAKPYTINVRRKDGSTFIAELEAKNIKDFDNKTIRIVSVRDISARIEAEKVLRESEQRLDLALKGANIGLWDWKVQTGEIVFNERTAEMLGYTLKELLPTNHKIWEKLVHPDDLESSNKLLEMHFAGKTNIYDIEGRMKNKKGEWVWVHSRGKVFEWNRKGKPERMAGIYIDITERKRAEKIQKVLFNISNAVTSTDNLNEFISLIQKELGTIIDTTNFYVALYDSEADTLSLPFFVDEKDKFTSFPAGKTLTYYVIKTRKSLFGTKEKIRELEKMGEVEGFGKDSKIWLGVPLKVERKITGVLAVQSYTDKNAYDESDMELLEFIADQVSISIERKKAETDLRVALKKATESDRLKSAFLATMSHELRTPLNAIIGFSDIVNEDLPIDDIVEFNKTINSSGNHLLSIVEDLFDVTLLEAGEIKIFKENVELHSIFADVHELICVEQQKNKKEHLNLNIKIPPKAKDLIIHTDQIKLKQILINLLKNAIKFTDKGHVNYGYSIKTDTKTEVAEQPVLSMLKENRSAEIEFYVEDTGIGISKDKQEIIFDAFRQVEDTSTRFYGGTGIGLSISKKLTELLGGEIRVESEKGKGTIFYFTIPYDGHFVDKKSNIVETEIKKESARKFENRTVLIVEDDESSFEFLKAVLEKSEINILWTKDGKDAVKSCRENPDIDLVLMDINIPGINGYEATKEIKKFNPNLPIIAQTANAIAGDKEKALEAGCDDYISKPIKQKMLLGKIEKWLS